MAKRKQFYAGKKPPKSGKKILILIAAVVSLAAIAVVSFLCVKFFRERRAEELAGRSALYCEDYGWETEKLEGVSDVKFFADGLLVYTDEKTGLQGLMTSDGAKTTEPLYTKFEQIRHNWEFVTYIAYPEGEEYPRLVKLDEKKVDIKQYQGTVFEYDDIRWDNASDALAWFDSISYKGEASAEELALENGLYPITDSSDSGKYGYIDDNLVLKIPVIYKAAGDFSCGLAAVLSDEGWSYINTEGKAVIKGDLVDTGYLSVSGEPLCFKFHQDIVPVKKGEVMGIVDTAGKTVVEFEFEIILPGEKGSFIAMKDGEWGVMTLEGVTLPPEVSTTHPSDAGRLSKGEYTVKTGGSPLRLRESADTESKILERIPNSTTVTVTKSIAGWAYVTYNSVGGWVSADFLIPVE